MHVRTYRESLPFECGVTGRCRAVLKPSKTSELPTARQSADLSTSGWSAKAGGFAGHRSCTSSFLAARADLLALEREIITIPTRRSPRARFGWGTQLQIETLVVSTQCRARKGLDLQMRRSREAEL